MSEPEKVLFTAEEFGLPATATAQEVRAHIKGMPLSLSEVKAERDTWRDRAEVLQAENAQLKAKEQDRKRLQAENIVEKARNAGKIDHSDVEFYIQLHLDNPAMCEKRLEQLRERAFLRTQESLKGTIAEAVIDAEAELAVRVAEIMANNPKLSQAGAVREAQKDKDLFERVTEARRQKAAAKQGGDR